MTEASRESEPSGIWLDSDEVHELRDQIQALRVGHSLISGDNQLDADEVREVYREMEEAISKLANSTLFRREARVGEGKKEPPQAGQ
ncbi:MAG: hypothetical protein AAFX06_23690 [Planctomycetota bacterium]